MLASDSLAASLFSDTGWGRVAEPGLASLEVSPGNGEYPTVGVSEPNRRQCRTHSDRMPVVRCRSQNRGIRWGYGGCGCDSPCCAREDIERGEVAATGSE